MFIQVSTIGIQNPITININNIVSITINKEQIESAGQVWYSCKVETTTEIYNVRESYSEICNKIKAVGGSIAE